MFLNKIKELENNQIKLQDLDKGNEISSIRKQIKELENKIVSLKQKPTFNIQILEKGIDAFITGRLRLLSELGYNVSINYKYPNFTYEVQGNKLIIEEAVTWYGETDYEQQEFSLDLFTGKHSELEELLKSKESKNIIARNNQIKKEELKQLQLLQEKYNLTL